MVWQEKFTLDGMAFYINPETDEVSWHKPAALMSKEEIEENKGEWVWVPHPTDMWQEGRVVKKDSDGTVHVAVRDGSLMKVPPTKVMQGPETGGRKQEVPLWELKKGNLRFLEDDLVMLDPVNEAFIIFDIAERYRKKQIYTWVGAGHSVLVSVNPYQEMNLYGEDQIQLHRNKPPNVAIPPHVFDIANNSYDSMAFERTDQSILISGESGAGKTEATKQCLKYLASVAGSEESNVEEKLLVANPLLEAFGNAKTIRNINSSRFGKWMEVFFNKQTAIIQGSRITNYLLERSRVVHQQNNERNYHIFYQLCANASCKTKYNLTKAEDFNYLNTSGCIKVPQIDEQKDHKVVMEAMKLLEFTSEEQESILQLTAAVLWLGNVSFEPKSLKDSVEGSQVAAGAPAQAMSMVSKMLELDEETVAKILCFRTIRPKAGKDSAIIPLNPRDARTACDSLAMGIYGKLFNWMVVRVNQSLGKPEGRFIGILDIFGFEIFENNSLEQLNINYANEKLQQLFNKTTFKEEEQLYLSEGVKFVHINFIDNQPVLDLIEMKPNGILPSLDDECLIPEGNDQKFMNKIEDRYAGTKFFQTDSKRRFQNNLSFEINHYAGVVKYDASLFMIKNVDTVFDDMYSAMLKSSNNLLKTIFGDADRKIKTLSYQFRGQLSQLMDVLYTTESRFIRCIKPNDEMSPNRFISASAYEQLRYSGVFEAVEIRKTGYPFRYTHKRFAFRYSCINRGYKYKSKLTKGTDDALPRVRELLDKSKQNFSEVQIGNTMVLYRANEYKLLKLLRNLALEKLIPKMQGVIRGGELRKVSAVLATHVKAIDAFIKKADDYEGLSKAIEAADPKKNFAKEQLKLFKFEARNMAVALKLRKDLEDWLGLERQMAELQKKCEEKGKPDAFYNNLKKIDEKVEETIKKQDEAEKTSKSDFYKRKLYVKPKLTKNQKALQKKMKDLIFQCILGQLDERVDKAVKNFDRKEIFESLKEAEKLKHKTDRINEARMLLEKFEMLDEDAQKAMKCVSKTMLKEVAENAKQLHQDNEILRGAKRMLNLDEKSFVQAEYERAKEVGDEKRRIHREIRLMEYKYDEVDYRQYKVENMASLRTREDYANSKLMSKYLGIGKQQLIDGMMVWTNKIIPTSLTIPSFEKELVAGEPVSPEKKQAIKAFKTEAKANFKDILFYMGDKKNPEPNEAASRLLARGLSAYKQKNDDMLQEMYVQVIKQLTQNPSSSPTDATEDPRQTPEQGTSFQNGLTLLGMMLSTFAPSTKTYEVDPSHPPTFDDAIVLWVLHNVVQANRKKYVSALHNVKYGEPAVSASQPSVLKNHFIELTGKFQIDPEADSGPEQSVMNLYLK